MFAEYLHSAAIGWSTAEQSLVTYFVMQSGALVQHQSSRLPRLSTSRHFTQLWTDAATVKCCLYGGVSSTFDHVTGRLPRPLTECSNADLKTDRVPGSLSSAGNSMVNRSQDYAGAFALLSSMREVRQNTAFKNQHALKVQTQEAEKCRIFETH
jgi:hypothetical protein